MTCKAGTDPARMTLQHQQRWWRSRWLCHAPLERQLGHADLSHRRWVTPRPIKMQRGEMWVTEQPPACARQVRRHRNKEWKWGGEGQSRRRTTTTEASRRRALARDERFLAELIQDERSRKMGTTYETGTCGYRKCGAAIHRGCVALNWDDNREPDNRPADQKLFLLHFLWFFSFLVSNVFPFSFVSCFFFIFSFFL